MPKLQGAYEHEDLQSAKVLEIDRELSFKVLTIDLIAHKDWRKPIVDYL